MSRAHAMQVQRLSRGIWSAGCSCGWLCDHPMRGNYDRAVRAWTAHRAHAETDTLAGVMRQVPRGSEADPS